MRKEGAGTIVVHGASGRPERGISQGDYLQLLLKNTPNAVILLNREGFINSCSAELLRMTGLQDESETLGQHFTDFYRRFEDEAFIRGAERTFWKIQAERRLWEEESKIDFSGKGKARAYVIQSIPLIDEKGDFQGAQVLIIDSSKMLATSQAFLLLDSMPLACVLRDAANRVIDCNENALRLFNMARKSELIERLNARPEEFPHNGRHTVEVQKFIRATPATGRKTFEWVFQRPNGEKIPIATTLVRVPWQGSHRIISYSHDLIEEKAREAQKRELENRIRTLLDATPLLSSIWDDEGRLLDCNAEAVRILKAPDKEYVLRHFIDELSPEFQPDGKKSGDKAGEMMQLALEKGEHRFEWTHRATDGELIPAAAYMACIPQEKSVYIASYCRDLREIKAKEAEAEEANARVQTMLDSMTLSCYFFDEEFRPVDCNDYGMKIYGCKSKKEYIDHFFEFNPPFQPDGSPSEEKAKEMIRLAYEQGEVKFYWEHRTMDGVHLPVEVTLRRVKWRDGHRVIAYMTDLREIAKERERAMAFEVQSQAAQTASEAKSNFLAAMSHEIRTPMNAIIGLTDLMRTENLDEQQIRYLRDIRGMSHVLLQIVNDILDLSKIEADKMELVPVDYNIRAVFDNVCSLIEATIRNKSLCFRCSIANDVPETLFGDEIRLRQIIFNILNNAVKYTQRGYVEFRIECLKRESKEWLTIIVRDTGIGIREEDIPRLFDPFSRFDTHKNRYTSGTGLGLPITRRLAQLMGGEIFVTSRYGEGSTFTVRLPLVEGDPAQMDDAETLRRVMLAPGVRILVVDDSPINLTVALGYLARHGAEAEGAESGQAAIEMIGATPYDLVFMDYMMPEMDGIETTRRIRAMEGERYRRLPIVALSANAVSGMRETFLAAGMNGFISKPIDPAELNRILANCLPAEKRIFTGEAIPLPTAVRAQSGAVLDQAAGAANFQGNEALYRKILASFRRQHGRDGETIAGMAAANDLSAARRAAHALKSVAAAIGAERLRRTAAEAESAFTDTHCEHANEIASLLTAELAQVLDELPPGRPEGKEEPAALTNARCGKALALLDKLEPLLADGDADCFDLEDEIVATFAPFGSSAKALAERMSDVDFSGALEIASALRRAFVGEAQADGDGNERNEEFHPPGG
ncbi:MAG: response regulator [Azoarcus sp.]|jgi:signal transduction histidine kinase/CheY-like chemotaxis protein|nr:response regulator [Azoarcus sp.]